MPNFPDFNAIIESHWKWTATQVFIVLLSFICGKFGFSYNFLFFLVTANLRLLNLKKIRASTEMTRIIRGTHTDEEIIRAQLGTSNIPSWVTFPDYESSEWLNVILKRIWPYLINEYQEKLLKKLKDLKFADGLEIEELQFGSIVSQLFF